MNIIKIKETGRPVGGRRRKEGTGPKSPAAAAGTESSRSSSPEEE